jgi:queuosine precursor transporter
VDRKHHLYLWLAGFFVTALIVGDIIGGRFFRVAGLDLSAGMLFFPLTFVLTDVVNEFYGPIGAKRITFIGLGMAGFTFLMINLVLGLPPSRIGTPPDAVATVLGPSMRLYIASLTAYLVGQLSDIAIFGILRRRTGHRMIWLRATGSTLISQAIDTIVINFVFLGGKESVHDILLIIRNSYVVKIAFAVGLTPLIYAAHGLFSRVLKVSETPEKA